MTEEKKQRLISAGTAMAVIILFVLIVVLAYLLITVGVRKKTEKTLALEKARLEQEIADAKEGIELWQKEWKIEERARQLDYVYKKDKNDKE